MKIICISNFGKSLPTDCLKPEWGFAKTKEFALVVNKVYTVHAFTILLGYAWYYICDENFSYYPVWHPAPLFKVVDHRLSRFWEFNWFSGRSADQAHMIVAFPEWARDRLYYDRLTDGIEKDVKIFLHYRKLIEDEVNSK